MTFYPLSLGKTEPWTQTGPTCLMTCHLVGSFLPIGESCFVCCMPVWVNPFSLLQTLQGGTESIYNIYITCYGDKIWSWSHFLYYDFWSILRNHHQHYWFKFWLAEDQEHENHCYSRKIHCQRLINQILHNPYPFFICVREACHCPVWLL